MGVSALRKLIAGDRTQELNGGKHHKDLETVRKASRRIAELEANGALTIQHDPPEGSCLCSREMSGGVLTVQILYPLMSNDAEASATFGLFEASRTGEGWPPHPHNVYAWVMVSKGRIRVTTYTDERCEATKRVVDVGAGRFYRVDPGVSHRVDVLDAPCEGALLCFPAEKDF